MSPDLVFAIANNGILVFWALLIVAPHWRGTELAVHSVAVPVALGLVYLWLFVEVWTGGVPGANYFSLAGVMALFRSPVAVTMGWVHYLVFDLFVGAWEARDAKARGVPHWLLVPCLIVTMMAGPVGLLLYLAVRRGGFLLERH